MIVKCSTLSKYLGKVGSFYLSQINLHHHHRHYFEVKSRVAQVDLDLSVLLRMTCLHLLSAEIITHAPIWSWGLNLELCMLGDGATTLLRVFVLKIYFTCFYSMNSVLPIYVCVYLVHACCP